MLYGTIHPDGAIASLIVWVMEAKRQRYAPSWRELLYRSRLLDEGWTLEEFVGLVRQLSRDGAIRLDELSNGAVVLRP